MERGEIWRVDLGPVSGHEQQGHRPVVIVTPKVFNERTNTPIVLPITTGGSFARRSGFTVPLDGVGAQTKGVIRCDQPRAINLMSRNGAKIETLPTMFMDEVLARLIAILD